MYIILILIQFLLEFTVFQNVSYLTCVVISSALRSAFTTFTLFIISLLWFWIFFPLCFSHLVLSLAQECLSGWIKSRVISSYLILSRLVSSRLVSSRLVSSHQVNRHHSVSRGSHSLGHLNTLMAASSVYIPVVLGSVSICVCVCVCVCVCACLCALRGRVTVRRFLHWTRDRQRGNCAV